MKNRLAMYGLVWVLAMVAMACSSDDGDDNAGSREVKFEVTGNFTGQLNAVLITASGGGTSESINALPWSKTITYESNVPTTQISIAGAGGDPGETITVKVIVGGKEKSSTPGTATNSGTIAVAAPSYAF
ncbi:hypothetical protein [Pseudochryseolinea flava]|nr:hypothetical protein [Pseudochryseolinea flava]